MIVLRISKLGLENWNIPVMVSMVGMINILKNKILNMLIFSLGKGWKVILSSDVLRIYNIY